MEIEEVTAHAKKRKLRLAAGIFIGLLILLTLAGNTLQSLTLPRVYTVEASSGELIHAYQGISVVYPSEVKELANPAGWKVSKVLVKKGEMVQKGQTLVEYDDSEAKMQLEDQYSALKKLQMSMEGLEHNYKLGYMSEDVSAKMSAKLAIETAKLDMDDQKRRIERLESEASEHHRLTAPFDGLILDVLAEEGFGGSGSPDVRISSTARGFQADFAIPQSLAELLQAGEDLEVEVDGENRRVTTGQLAEWIAADSSAGNGAGSGAGSAAGGQNAPTASIRLLLSDQELRGGEKVSLNLKRSKATDSVIVPNEAIRKDLEGAYVYILNEQQGPLGNAYYAMRVSITIADANETSTAVSSGLFDKQRVILSSSEPVMDGMRVRY
ncbi:efflux RND transporter periplasmic adaptor subunit [Paenibacillus sp. 1011MAR3C5]|uniref:efflux RND transporter periplasmic adaptor subunit n=1 Tax=Paenibacillus sp. 1011MAR3C5 TaxID=1675787 RepID=UPI000E6B5A8B|nr:efflux RND transporter periplasmic adaptor subunit [Paenibacillus sp. 1011MAR3C5]RJE83934.1 efflux RND transporter periplasmic adaptor subunit [Paenibacillus sp. 1011MAR3C5]